MNLLPLALLAVSAAPPAPAPFDAETAYRVADCRGWTLKINKRLDAAEHDDVRKKALELLDDHLYRVTRAIPEPALSKIRKVPIWIEVAHPKHPCMCYHPSKEWLRANGMNPAKAGGVELANVKNFLSWTHQQPWMVLHELAHAYHDRELGFDHEATRTAYREAMRQKLYESVLHIDGRKRKHYAATNPQEYFAEATEAYFGTNDFFPFVRAELREHDPRGYELMGKAWGVRGR